MTNFGMKIRSNTIYYYDEYKMFLFCLEWHFSVQFNMYCIKVVNCKMSSRFWTHLLVYNLFCSHYYSNIICFNKLTTAFEQRFGRRDKNSTTRSLKLEYALPKEGNEWSIQYSNVIIYYGDTLHETFFFNEFYLYITEFVCFYYVGIISSGVKK